MKTKKILVIVLAVMFVLGMSTTAFAGEATKGNELGTEAIGVTGSYSEDSALATVYSVKIEWGAMNFTYTSSGEREWDPATHTYKNETTGWSYGDEGDNAVTVTNHSNAPVNVAFSFAATTDESGNQLYGDYVGVMSEAGRQLAAGVEGDFDGADHITSVLIIAEGGKLNRGVKDVKLGEITVTLTSEP